MKLGRFYMVRKTFSFTDKEVLEWIAGMRKGEVSGYIQELIKEDMKKEKGKNGVDRNEVIKILQEYFKNNAKIGNEVNSQGIDDKVKNSMKGLIRL